MDPAPLLVLLFQRTDYNQINFVVLTVFFRLENTSVRLKQNNIIFIYGNKTLIMSRRNLINLLNIFKNIYERMTRPINKGELNISSMQ